jgi:DNA-binding response OmpR family regulator
MSGERRTILLVEDERNDVFFLEYAFQAAGITNPMQVVEDGQQAIDYLAGIGKFANRTLHPMPCLVLLDLKLPIKMGLDVLRWIRQQPALQTLLVIVLSSSRSAYDVDEAYRLGARSYLVKPLSMNERFEIARAIKYYWLGLNEFPAFAGCNKLE